MAAFDRDNVTRNETLGIPARKTNTPAWIAGIVVVAVVVLGAYGYDSGIWGTHGSVIPTATHEMTQTRCVRFYRGNRIYKTVVSVLLPSVACG